MKYYKKAIAGVLLAVMFTSTTAFAMSDTEVKMIFASNTNTQSNVTEFTDLTGYEWAKGAIEDMASKGVVVGVGDNKYAPAKNVTRQEFAIMAIRAMKGDIGDLANQASQKAKTDSNYTDLDTINSHPKYQNDKWANSLICAIQMFPELDSVWGISKDAWSADADRAEMAFIVMTIAEQLGNEDFAIKDGIETKIADYNAVSQSPYKNYILKAYSNGILVGEDNQGSYNPSNNANRAMAAAIMQRAMEPSTRKVVEVTAPEVVTPPVQNQTANNIGDYGTVFPKEGDVINGKTVVRDADTGILGLDVKGGIYLGIEEVYADGTKHTIQVGSISSNSYDNMTAGDKYVTKHGYTFWGSEWRILDNYAGSRLPMATSALVGTKADIKGNIIKDGSSEPAFYECQFNPGVSNYQWVSI